MPTTLTRKQRPPRRRQALWLAALSSLALASWVAVKWNPVTDLSNARSWAASGVKEAWAKGQVVVLIRHAERCDRSEATCLAAEEGITVNGSLVASDAGAGISALGLHNADLQVSPSLRTRQTAHAMFGNEVADVEWLQDCNDQFAASVIAHKREGRNLVAVTHSGCMDHFQRTMGIPSALRDTPYAGAMFVTVVPDDTPDDDLYDHTRLLGMMEAEDWPAPAQVVKR